MANDYFIDETGDNLYYYTPRLMATDTFNSTKMKTISFNGQKVLSVDANSVGNSEIVLLDNGIIRAFSNADLNADTVLKEKNTINMLINDTRFTINTFDNYDSNWTNGRTLTQIHNDFKAKRLYFLPYALWILYEDVVTNLQWLAPYKKPDPSYTTIDWGSYENWLYYSAFHYNQLMAGYLKNGYFIDVDSIVELNEYAFTIRLHHKDTGNIQYHLGINAHLGTVRTFSLQYYDLNDTLVTIATINQLTMNTNVLTNPTTPSNVYGSPVFYQENMMYLEETYGYDNIKLIPSSAIVIGVRSTGTYMDKVFMIKGGATQADSLMEITDLVFNPAGVYGSLPPNTRVIDMIFTENDMRLASVHKQVRFLY